MSWINRELQNNILHILRDEYRNPLKFWVLKHKLYNKNNNISSVKIIDSTQDYYEEEPLESEDCSNDDSNENLSFQFQENLIRNLFYLEEHSLISILIISQYEDSLLPESSQINITAKGIDFIENDGGLSAILNVVTVKLHSETIQQLLTAKISEADIPEEEKNKLKEALKTVQNSALETLTEKAIETIPAMQLIGFLKAVVGL